MSGGFSWADFEKIMIRIRKIKSHAFEDGANITVGDFHRSAFRDPSWRVGGRCHSYSGFKYPTL